jgi:hypothetical protein
MISFDVLPGPTMPGQRTIAGTRKPLPNWNFSSRSGVIGVSGQVFMCGRGAHSNLVTADTASLVVLLR